MTRALAAGVVVALIATLAGGWFVEANACRPWMPTRFCDDGMQGWATAMARGGWLWAAPVFAGVAAFLVVALRR
ncbi:hypothetical protein JQC91_11805 [Jannaschia sp. Os4]|uniref:hypothetical protein n=1 Tax=Jannaschia sp. Os4 TaxID=2807617 RepID=UPI00193A69A7|nr:hypothetical protein [Jannaschia sp. Os4]MBM2576983.1 hypothetical protein [Jannaschia sp. Os4]